jgi:hypothetical protein
VTNPYNRRTQPELWQKWFDEQVAAHDEANEARDVQQELESHRRAREAAERDDE